MVVGTTRTPGKADALRTAGARPVGLESLSQPACSSEGRMLSTRSVNRMTKETRPSDQEAKSLRIARSRHRIAWPTRQEDRSWLCRRESARSKVTQ
jgi:hypothetical protein